MVTNFAIVLWALAALVGCHPTMYKLKDNKTLELDLVPVSSTVIPLPVYKVGYGLNVVPSKGQKVVRPEGPVTLITASNKKKYYTGEKPKFEGTSTIKEVKQ